jgi:hypothetical protein
MVRWTAVGGCLGVVPGFGFLSWRARKGEVRRHSVLTEVVVFPYLLDVLVWEGLRGSGIGVDNGCWGRIGVGGFRRLCYWCWHRMLVFVRGFKYSMGVGVV